MLQNIRIVLVETSHTGNMGSVARAMKTMGLTNLWLVNPLVKPDSQAIALAAGASVTGLALGVRAALLLVDDAALKDARIALAGAVRQVIRNGLAILGVSCPQSM